MSLPKKKKKNKNRYFPAPFSSKDSSWAQYESQSRFHIAIGRKQRKIKKKNWGHQLSEALVSSMKTKTLTECAGWLISSKNKVNGFSIRIIIKKNNFID